jgi:hypothetical protein
MRVTILTIDLDDSSDMHFVLTACLSVQEMLGASYFFRCNFLCPCCGAIIVDASAMKPVSFSVIKKFISHI